MPDRLSISMQPAGVQGTNLGVRPFITSSPMFIGWKPSTSFSMLMRSSTFLLVHALGEGQLHEDAVHGRVGIQRPHQVFDFLLRRPTRPVDA